MVGKDFVLNAVLECLELGMSEEDIGKKYGLDDLTMATIAEVYHTGEKWGATLTGYDCIDIYKNGLTFSEIAWMKGVTKVAIRLMVDGVIGDGKEALKKHNRERRRELRSIILYDMIVVKSEEVGREQARLLSGYSKGMFNQLYRSSVRWKESKEDVEEGKQEGKKEDVEVPQ